MQTLWQDLRYGFRILLQRRGFTAVAVLTMALGIGANTAVFTVANAVVLRPLPFKDAERLVVLWESNPQNKQNEVAAGNFIDFSQQNQIFEQVASLHYSNANLTGGVEPERLQAAVVTPSFFPALGVQAALGRTFLPEEDKPGAAGLVILSDGLWQRRFGADPSLIGETITLNGSKRTVIGTMPRDFQFQFPTNRQVDVWLPRIVTPQFVANRVAHFLYVVARLKPAVTITQAQAEMDAVADGLGRQYPNTNRGVGVALVPLHTQIVGNVRPALLILLGTVAFLLLIACANVANLLLGRATARQKEIAIRAALGATRLRVARQLLTESVLLAFFGGAFALMLAFLGTRLIVAVSPATIPRLNEIGIDGQVLGFTLLVSLLTGVIFGLAPALQASRVGPE